MLGGEGDIEGLDVGEEVLDFAPADDGEHVWDFLHQVGDCDFCGYTTSVRGFKQGGTAGGSVGRKG